MQNKKLLIMIFLGLISILYSVSALEIDISYPEANKTYGIDGIENITWTTNEESTCSWSLGSVVNASMGFGTLFNDKKRMITLNENTIFNDGRSNSFLYSFNNKIFIYGGINSSDWLQQSDIYSSSDDGETWQFENYAEYGRRGWWYYYDASSFCEFNGFIYVIAGRDYSNELTSDVWRSSDGSHFERIADNIFGEGRSNLNCVVFNNELYLYSSEYNDMYKSSNGINWTIHTTQTELDTIRGYYGNLIPFKNKVYYAFGWDMSSYYYNPIIYETTNMINFTPVANISYLFSFSGSNLNNLLLPSFAIINKEVFVVLMTAEQSKRTIISTKDMINWKIVSNELGEVTESTISAHKGKLYNYGGAGSSYPYFRNDLNYYENLSSLLVEGDNELTITCNTTDTDLTTKKLIFRRDTLPPSISIFSPTNITYNTNNISIEYSVSDLSLDKVWYELNGVFHGYLTAITTFIAQQASNILTIYANDTLNNQNSVSVSFSIILDSDNDGIANSEDSCPQTYGCSNFSGCGSGLGELLPPITSLQEFELQEGATLPFKFTAADCSGAFYEDAGIKIRVINQSLGIDLTYNASGQGSEFITIDLLNEQYVLNIHTGQLNMSVGTYDIDVMFSNGLSYKTGFELVEKGPENGKGKGRNQ